MIMNTDERIQKLPEWIRRIVTFLKRIQVPAKLVYISMSILASGWFLVRVIQKPSRATYPCMQVAAPMMSGLVIWILAATGATFAFSRAKRKLFEAKYLIATIFMALGIGATFVFMIKSSKDVQAETLKIWYKPNIPMGEAKGLFPGRVAWGHNPKIASWDGKTGFWWEDRFNNQEETNKLFSQTLFSLTGKTSEKQAWDELFRYFNQTKHNQKVGYKTGEKVAIKINENNTSAHENTNEINANPQVILSLLNSLVKAGGVQEEDITVADPSRFITNNIFDKCHAVFPKVHFVDHNGGDGREKAGFTENAFLYSVDFKGQTKALATCMIDAKYIINLALLKGHVSQGVTLCAKNYFGCTSIETDWRKNAHSSGFSQDRDGKRTYSVYPDFMGHKDLGGKTMLFLIDGIYGNKFVNGIPAFKWVLAPFNNEWPCSLFASQDGVAIDAVGLDLAFTEWPDAPDMKYSDFYLEEMALANNPPSGSVYDPERDGTKLTSLGVTEHWNNPIDKKYSRNLGKDKGIELVYSLVKK
jgi:hypothetical protein